MGFIRSFEMILLTAAFALTAETRHLHSKHEAVAIERRQLAPPIAATPIAAGIVTTSAAEVLTFITPSPGASPVAITEQSQLVTSYVPQYTLCELPPKAFFPVTPTAATVATTAPFRNFSVSIPSGSGTCTTTFSPTRTMVCATTLTGLVQKYTVTNCAQDITFSSEYGYVLARPTAAFDLSSAASPSASDLSLTSASSTLTAEYALITAAPTVQRLTTYFLAPWQSVTAGLSPEDVALKVCALYANGTEECIRQYEVWHTSLLTETATLTSSVNISATLQGLSQVIVGTFAANITADLTTFRMTTDLQLEYQTEYETTSRELITPTTAGTSYVTRTLLDATPSAAVTSTIKSTSTVYRTSTTTLYIGTSTALMPSLAAADSQATAVVPETVAAVSEAAGTLPEFAAAIPTPAEAVDWVSKLGIATARK